MTIINKRLSVVCPDKKCPIFPFKFRWTHLSIFQLPVVLFCVLFVIHSPAWAGISSLSVDANGDSVFDGDTEKLTITFTTSDALEDEQVYRYEIYAERLGDRRQITTGPDTDQKLLKNQTVEFIWDGKRENPDKPPERVDLDEGVYTIKVVIDNDSDPNNALPAALINDLTIEATLDKTPPKIEDVSVGYSEFSPIFDSVPVYYTLSEDVAEAWLEIERGAGGGGSIGRRIELDTTKGSHTFYWDGEDGNRRIFEDGSYKLKLNAIDRGGNTAVVKTTEQITIDSEEPTITGIQINDSIPLIDGSYVNAAIQSISFTADASGGTPLYFSHRDTEIRIRPVGGTNLRGALTVTGNNRAELTLGNTLDDFSENGNYEVTVFISDRVGNLASSRVRFHFDNTPPTLIGLSTNREEFTQGSGLSGRTSYVEAELEDNIELDLPGSSIRLKGPDGSLVLGEQTQISTNKIRWQLRTPLLATDGIQDGQYTVEIIGADKANNRTEPISIAFIFDNLAPELVSLQPTRDGPTFNILGGTTYYNLPLNQFVATFSDGESGIGVLFAGSQDITNIIFGTPKSDGSIDAISGRAFVDKDNSVLTYILDSPILSTDGSQDGTYLISIKAIDALGNSNIINYQLIYDTQVPKVTSTVPAPNQTVSSLTEVVVKLNEKTSGIDFAQSNYRLTRSIGENQVEVPVNIASNGSDTVTLTLLQQIALDGSDDGTYTIEVTPADNAGNVGAAVRRPFYLVSTTKPKVRLTAPQNGTISSITDIAAVLENYIGTGINYDRSNIVVTNANGVVVPNAKVEHDAVNNQLTWSTETAFPRNGTADGEYAVFVFFVDFTGERYTQTFPLLLDTQYPSIETVKTVTEPMASLSIDSAIDVNQTFSQINVTFVEDNIDFENTVISLVGPDNTEIAFRRSNDGDAVLSLNFRNLSSNGTYTLTVTPTDRIGNISELPYVYKFDLEIAVPVVATVLIGGKSGGLVYVDDSVDEIIATLVDPTGIGLAAGDSESRIVVTSETGLPVPGTTVLNDEDQQNWQLIWRPTVLPTDGSADGTYTVSVTPVDNAGRTGDVALRGFIYDTQEPRVTSASPLTLHQPVSYLGGSFPQLQFTIEDVGPALFDLDTQSITLAKNDGEIIDGKVTHDGVNQLFFTLSAPLPSDGSADGEYLLTVDLIDRSGNAHQGQHNIFYDSQAPLISTVSLNTDTPLDLIPYQVTDLRESVNKITVNFVESTRVDFENTVFSLIGPDGSDIPFNLENNGVDQLTASFVSLIRDGLYTLSITSQDITGNSARGEALYPFRLEFAIPKISTVKANTSDTLIDLIPHQIVHIDDVINQVTLTFTDPTRLDFENTNVELLAPNGQQISLTQEAFIQEGNLSQLSVRFISITENGVYTLRVTPQDIAGNIAQTAVEYQFRLDIALPSVSSILIEGQLSSTIYVNDAITTIVATFIEPAGVGLALSDDFSDDNTSITVTNESGVEVAGNTQSNDLNQLTWKPLRFPADGSVDGIYNVSVTPADKVGRKGKVVNRQFIYDTQAPRITASSLIELHQPMTYVGGSLTQFQITVEDVGPALLELDSQEIKLHQSDGEDVSGVLTHDNSNQLYFTLSTPLPTDGSADGEYGITVKLVDNAGNSDEAAYKVYYDSQAPSISTVTLNTETPLNLTPYKVTELTETVSKLTLRFVDSTRMDFANTNIVLTAPNATEIPLTITNNGVDKLTANFVTLTQDGEYTLSVTPQDIAGNVAKGAVLYLFRLDSLLPSLTSVKAKTTNDTVSLTPYEIVEVTQAVSSFILEFTDVMQIDIENTNVTLSGPDSEGIDVSLEEDDGSQIVVRFVPLTRSGTYRLSITPQDTSGNVAQSATTYQFRLDLQGPAITSVNAQTTDATIALSPYEIIDITETVNSIALGFSDVKRIDIGETDVALSGPNGESVVVTLEADEGSELVAPQLVVRFVPLARSGTYSLSITPQDTSGNVAQSATTYQFRLDLQVPAITSVNANTTDAAIALTPFEITDITETFNSIDIGFSNVKLIDIEGTNVTLSGPDGEGIAVSLEKGEGSDIVTPQLVVRFVPLARSGTYSLSITPQDTSGNVAQSATTYQFRLDLQVPAITSVNANTTDAAIALTPFEITDITETFNSIDIGFSDVKLIDVERTNVALSGPDGEGIAVSLEENEGSDIVTPQLVVRFVQLTRSGTYSLSITPQDTSGNIAQSATTYQFRLDLQVPTITSVNANTTDTAIPLTPFEIKDITETVNSIGIGFSDVKQIDIEGTNVVLSGPDAESVVVSLEEGDGSEIVVRFVPLAQSGTYRLSITPQDRLGNVAQTATTYQFQLDLQVPAITSVNAKTTDATIALSPYEIVDITETVNSIALGFSNVKRIDIEDTDVALSGPNGESVVVTLEADEGSELVTPQLVVRFVPLTRSGTYSLSITPQDTTGNVAQSATTYQFRLDLQVPAITSVNANTTDAAIALTPFEITDITETFNSIGIGFSNVMRIDIEGTNVALSGPDGEGIAVSLEEDEGSDIVTPQLVARFVQLTRSGTYSLSITPQDTSGNIAQSATTYQFQLDLQGPAITSVNANTTDAAIALTPFEIKDITETVNSIALGFSDVKQIDIEGTNVVLSGPDGESVVVSLEEGDGSEIVVRFVPLAQSGTYRLSITPQDRLGNVAQTATTYQFRLDLQVPAITSVNAKTTDATIALSPYEIVDITETVNSIALGFSDVKRIDIEDTDVALSGPNGESVVVTLEVDKGSELVTPQLVVPQLVVRFVPLTRSGSYRLSITPQDTTGNVAQSVTTYQFQLDLQVPAITSVNANTTDAAIALTPFEITDITETFNSIGIGFSDVMRIDIEGTNVALSGPDGEGIAVSLEEDEGSDIVTPQLVARFVQLTRSGTYSLSITPQDTSGNIAQSATTYQFQLDLQVPAITSVNANTTDAAIPLTPFEIKDITETVNSIGIGFPDVKQIDIEGTNVVLSGPDGESVVASLEEGDGSEIVVRFVPLAQSGTYRLSITPQDRLGNVAQTATTYQFRLNLQLPAITSVNANIADTHVALTLYEESIISHSFSSFTLEFTDAEKLDDEKTLIGLSGPNEQEIAITLEKGENSKYVVRFVTLTENGLYTLSVTPQDKAGNVGQGVYQYQFRIDIALPTVQSISIDGKLGATVYVSNSTPRIIASLTDTLDVGLSFGDSGSNITVTNSNGLQVPGTTTMNDSNQLIWIPIPLATDGSADGQYSVAVTPVDLTGRSGTVVNRNFIYDSQAPRITAASPITLHAPVSYIGSGLSEFILTIEDEGPAGFVLLSQVAALMDASGKPVPATITHDDFTDQLYLTLSTPFANDGSTDGTYTLNVALTDKAGNRKTSQYKVVYDSRIPQISSVQVNTAGVAKDLVANKVTELSESISTITVSFSEATRVDFANTDVTLLDPSDLSVPLTIEDDGVSEMTIGFPNLTEIGQYILSVTPQDIAGNTATNPFEYTFNLAFILPTVESIQIGNTVTLASGDIAYVNADNLVIVANLLDPAGTGLSFDPLTGSGITVTTLDGITVFGSTDTNNSDVLTWEPITLSTDGSSDGRYAVYVTPIDKEGREGSTIYREFILDTQEPEITSASPINLSQPVSYISESLTQLQFVAQDVGPADLLLENQQISLRNQSGVVIPTKLTNDSQNQLYLTLDEPLPLDGSMDGEYTAVIAFTDKAGNMLAVEHPIIYDTQAPTLVNTVPDDGELLTEDLTQIVVNLSDEGDSSIDWSNTTVTLVDPNNVEISGDVSSNGKTQLTLNTNQLVADGRYTIRVKAVDRAGNGNLSVFESSFLLSRLLPAVISTVPITAPENEAYINEAVQQIEVMLQTVDVRHLSTVRLLNADGQVVAGQQHRQPDKLIYQLVRPLATDGSEDGVYTIEFTPISASGRSGEVQSMTFTYDTQAPELITDDIQLIVAEPEMNNSLVEIRVPITDSKAGLDWENLDDEWFAFEQLTQNRTEIAGRLSYDDEQNTLIFRLNVPLADNGSADGEYRITIKPIDKAGNGDETYEKELTYDTSPPVIDTSTLLLNDAPLLTDIDAVDYPSAISTSSGVVIQASITDVGLGVNLSQSSINIKNPNGQEISGTSQQNGIDTIVFKSDGLNIEGIYQVTITGTGNDSELLGFAPKASITVAFLYETTEPTASVTNDAGKTEFTDEAIPFEGTTVDPEGSRRAGQQGENEVPVPASGVFLVEIVGTGPDGQEIEPVPAKDDSNAQGEPWSSWSVDFLPTRSGEYDLDLRVTDKAGNYTVYDIGEYTMSVSFSFKGNTFGWPNPLRKTKDGVAFFSFDLNAPADEAIDMTLYIYDWSGDLVYKQKYANITTGQRDDTRIKWNLKNQAGNAVARGIYVFRLEAVNRAGNRANAVGKILVVD